MCDRVKTFRELDSEPSRSTVVVSFTNRNVSPITLETLIVQLVARRLTISSLRISTLSKRALIRRRPFPPAIVFQLVIASLA